MATWMGQRGGNHGAKGHAVHPLLTPEALAPAPEAAALPEAAGALPEARGALPEAEGRAPETEAAADEPEAAAADEASVAETAPDDAVDDESAEPALMVK